MRVSVFVSVALVAVLLAEGTSSGSCVHFAKPRAKPREIRGFQPEYISTAYGFGKREIAKQDKYEKIMLLLLQNSPQRFVTLKINLLICVFGLFLGNRVLPRVCQCCVTLVESETYMRRYSAWFELITLFFSPSKRLYPMLL